MALHTSLPDIRANGCDIEWRDALGGPGEAEAIFAFDVVAGLSRRSTLVVCSREARPAMCTNAVCQIYDQWPVAPAGVQAARGALWVMSDLGGR
jgi:hypothetical protein